MFLLNLGYKWTFAQLDGLKGAVVLPCGNSRPRVERDHPGDFQTLLFDPQLYLAGIEVEPRVKTCARLAGYPWFGVRKVANFDSGLEKRKDWEAKLRDQVLNHWPGRASSDLAKSASSAVEFQMEFGCTSVILPTPLVDEREDEASLIGTWLDAGLEAAEELETPQPLLASVALAEHTLTERAFDAGGLIEAVVDQVTARPNIDGVYIVVVQSGAAAHPFEASAAVARAYLHLSRDFAAVGMRQILTNFADLVGLAAMGVGATGFGSGQSSSLRGVYADGFRDEGGGIALPHYYSHKSATEYRTESDLGRIVKKRLFRRIADETQASAPLVAALRGGGSASSLPNWVESQNILAAAHQHYLERLLAEGATLHKARKNQRLDAVLEWLEAAEGTIAMLDKRLGERVGRAATVDLWRDIIDNLGE